MIGIFYLISSSPRVFSPPAFTMMPGLHCRIAKFVDAAFELIHSFPELPSLGRERRDQACSITLLSGEIEIFLVETSLIASCGVPILQCSL